MRLKITVLAGDGVGPEVTAEAVRVLRAVAGVYGHKFEFIEMPVGGAALSETGEPLPRATLDACLAGDAVLLGAVGSPEFDNLKPDQRPEAGLLKLRTALGAYANLRPAVAYDAVSDCSPLRAEVVRDADILI
ncbi:MAG TPA: isocitrate/isopropylmalate family dehydrogenase, partial [Pyrinomonadaceae bacterium]|nr:isocitrate/isopropylmalate family dehydrogenase [Pyrinomonadaceae bacterium]